MNLDCIWSYNPAWSHIKGVITVENPEFSSELGSISNDSSVNGIDEKPVLNSNITNVINSNVDGLATSEDGSSSFPLSSFSSSFPNSTTNNVSDQPSTPSSPSSDHALANIFNKIGPLLGLLMNENTSSSSPPPSLSSLSQSNESFGIGDFDNQSSFPSSTTQSSNPDHALANIFNKIGPLLGLLMNENILLLLLHHRHHSPLSHNLTNPLVSVTLIINPHSVFDHPILKSKSCPCKHFRIESVPYLAF